MSSLTVLEAYFKVYSQFILAISGLSGCNKKGVAQELSKHFNAKLIDQYDYYKKDYQEVITVSGKGNSVDIINWDTDEAVDWEKFNKDVNKFAKISNVVILAFNLKTNLIDFNVDFHVYLNMNKSDCIKKRIKKLEKNKGGETDDHNLLNNNLFETKMFNITFPFNEAIVKEMKINKFIKISELKTKEIADIIWELVKIYLINAMENFNKKDYQEWIKTNKFN